MTQTILIKLGVISALAAGVAFFGCSGGEGEEDSSDPALVVAKIEFDLDRDRLLSSLSDQEIQDACGVMARVIQIADEGVACQIVAAAEDSEKLCTTTRDACLESSTEALSQTTLRATPAPIDCDVFDSALTVGCDFPVSLLEDCANSLAQSVVPAAEAVDCSEASEISNLSAAEQLAAANKATDFVTVCLDLLACESLVGALLGGGSGPGDGGAGGGPH
jgi:hypothetical protein